MSLRGRIVLAVAVVFASLNGLADWLLLNRVDAQLTAAFDRVLQSRAETLLSKVSTSPVVLPIPAETEQMRVQLVVDGQPTELFRSPNFPQNGGQNGSVSYRTVVVQSTDEADDQRQTVLTLALPDTALRQDQARLRWLFGLGWLLSLALAFGAGYGVAGWLLRPIQTIIGQANRISHATTIDPIPLPDTRDELYDLTSTINQMLSRLRDSADGQRNFFAAAAHELRTPLAVLRTGLQVNIANPQLSSPTIQLLTDQLADVQRLTRLVDEFLALSQADDPAATATVKPVGEPIQLPALLAYCMAQLAPVALDYGIGMMVQEPSDTDTTLVLERIKLEHILLNLLENAIKYAAPGSTILLSCPPESPGLVWVQNQTVQASGLTLPLSQPYYRADPMKEGHGLGLWISHRLATLLGGKLTLHWHDHQFTAELQLPV